MQFHDNLEIPGGNTRRQTNVEVGLGYSFAEDKCLNLPKKWDQGRTYGRNHDCKRPDPRYKMNLYQRNNLFKRSFNDKIYIVSMGMNTSSRSTPTSPMHNLSFTSHVRWSCSVEILSGEAPEEYDSWKISGSHGLEKAYVQPIGAS